MRAMSPGRVGQGRDGMDGEGGNVDTLYVRLEMDDRHFHSLFRLLQGGFMVEAETGCSIRTFLCGQLMLSAAYVEERIRAVFLDGRPVDDIGSATVKDGSHLALSAAMPGLVGVTLSRGSMLAPLRGSITHRETGRAEPRMRGTVHMKLFNLAMKETGRVFLERGVYVRSWAFAAFAGEQSALLRKACRRILLNGKPAGLHELLDAVHGQDEGWVFLTVSGSEDC